MNDVFGENSSPTDVTFFIGPIGSPANIKQAYQHALDRDAGGEREPLDELLEILLSILSSIAGGPVQEPSPLKKLVEDLINCEIGEIPAYVGTGFTRGTWTPILTIHLNRLKAPDGSPLGHRFLKSHGEILAAMLGRTFKSEWIYTSWAYPRSPIDISPISGIHDEREDL